MNDLLATLKAAAEPTRLRLLALCAEGELTVSELTAILAQSQPRVSRHLKLLCDAGLLDRFREGTYAFYRLAEKGAAAKLARVLVDAIPGEDPWLSLDRERLAAIKRGRSDAAAAYFRDNARRWHQIRSLHVPEREVEAALLKLLSEDGVEELLDIGTGTGRMLEVFGPHARHAVGVDLSREMLAVARTNLEAAGLRHCHVRQADLYQLPFPGGSFDAAIIHLVLHFVETPALALAEAARVLKPGGRLLVVDFAPHGQDRLRLEHAHRHPGFADEEMAASLERAGLVCDKIVHLPGEPLTVSIWPANKPLTLAPHPHPATTGAHP